MRNFRLSLFHKNLVLDGKKRIYVFRKPKTWFRAKSDLFYFDFSKTIFIIISFNSQSR